MDWNMIFEKLFDPAVLVILGGVIGRSIKLLARTSKNINDTIGIVRQTADTVRKMDERLTKLERAQNERLA